MPVTITDPAFKILDSAYMRAFVTGSLILLVGKAELSDGEIRRLYVSNAE